MFNHTDWNILYVKAKYHTSLDYYTKKNPYFNKYINGYQKKKKAFKIGFDDLEPLLSSINLLPPIIN
jgi:hypothetical protein